VATKVDLAPTRPRYQLATHLILGGCGFIGRHVAARLLQQGQDVVLADRQPLISLASYRSAEKLRFETFDLCSADWTSLIADCDVIHHYAWSSLPQSANENPAADLSINVGSIVRLMEAVRACGGRRLVFASSGGTVYGKLKQIPVREDHPLNPITAYGVSKVAAEKYLGLFRELYGADCRVARISNPFGAGQDPTRQQGAVTTFLLRALAGQKITIWGDGEVVRDYIHISDLTHALATLASVSLDHYTEFPVFNIGSGQGTSLNELLRHIAKYSTRPIEVEYVAPRSFDIPVNVLDVSLAEEVLGWCCALSFDQGIQLAISDMRRGETLFSTLR
jgi:UDP-glucose 4-epimerase